MQHAIVPYVPPGCSSRSGHQRSFASFVRSGGRVNPLPFGATEDLESVPLMPDKKEASEALQIMRTASRQARITQCAVIVALLFAIAVFTGVGFLVWRVNADMDSVEEAVRPHATQIVDGTMDMMHDIGGSIHNMYEISGYSTDVAAVAGGTSGTAVATLNNTAIITQRLAQFLAHPTIQLSLGGT